MRGPAVLLLLSCLAVASGRNVKKGLKVPAGKRDLDGVFQNQYKPFVLPGLKLQPPPYMNSLLNQVLDLKGGGHSNYLNVYPTSWTTNQVNSELTVEVLFTAFVNNQNVHCNAHVSASMPPGSSGNPTIVPAGSLVQCSPSTDEWAHKKPPLSINAITAYGNGGYRRQPLYPDAFLNQPTLYNRVPYAVPPAQQMVYRTKYVPIHLPTVLPFARLPVPPNPYAPPLLQGGPLRIPQYNAWRDFGLAI